IIANNDRTYRTVTTNLDSSASIYGRVFAGEFNGDDHVDVAILDQLDLRFRIAYGTDDGRFTNITSIELPRRMFDGAVADVTGDHKSDIVIIDGTDVVFYAGGTSRRVIATGGEPTALATADFDRDGREDLVVAGPDEATLFLSSQASAPGMTIAIPIWTHYGALVAADFTGDGRIDIAARSEASHDVTILVANEDGTFSPGRSFAVANPWTTTRTIAGDFDGDGNVDLAMNLLGDFQVVFNRGRGLFDAAQTYATEPGATRIAVADLNRDDHDDVVVISRRNIDVRIAGDDGTLGAPQKIELPQDVVGGVLEDFTGDGYPDLFIAGVLNGVLRGPHFGNTGAWEIDSVDFLLVPSDLATGDVDGDGLIDVVVVYEHDRVISIYRSRGDGKFDRHSQFITTKPRRVELADFDEDGHLDAAITSELKLLILRGTGDAFESTPRIVLDDTDTEGLETADVNGDGHADVLSFSNQRDALNVLLGRGDGTFAQKRIRGSGSLGNSEIVATELTGDGVADLVISVDSSLIVMEGDGAGGFTELWREITIAAPDIAVGDFNSDGLGDIAQLSTFPGTNGLQVFSSFCASRRVAAPPIVRLRVENVTSHGATLVATVSEPAEGVMVQFYAQTGNQFGTIGSAPIVNGEARFPFRSLLIASHEYWAYFTGRGRLTRGRSNTVTTEPPIRRRATGH
ncbi:MAG TPA: VCBS repeat-containing protein, partial [Thermoanaerobaculia bacterium]|nr:VCBS repeat-containing protein [Thermoanaerobaculia bacterium]